jgi:biopolymer transport protein TolR
LILARRPRRLVAQMNVVPYIDVMLVLLVIFMITAPLINPGSIDLPSIGKSLSQPEQPIEVDVHKDGSLTVIDRAEGGAEARMSRDDLVAWVKDRQVKRPDQPVVIAGDRNAKYESILQIMDILQQAAVKRIGLLAKSKDS